MHRVNALGRSLFYSVCARQVVEDFNRLPLQIAWHSRYETGTFRYTDQTLFEGELLSNGSLHVTFSVSSRRDRGSTTLKQPPETRQSLLLRIRESKDNESWTTFVSVYTPVIHAYALRKGMQDADAADVTQQVMRSVFQAIPDFEYDPSKGSFRGWLFTITRNCIIKAVDKRSRTPTATGDTSFQQSLQMQQATNDEEEAWNRDHELYLFRCAAERVKHEFKESTWEAFWKAAVEALSPEQTANKLGISVGAVYIAKSRVIARIRAEIEKIEADLC